MVSLRQFMDISECQEVLAAVTEAHSLLLRALDESVVDAAEPGAALLVHRRLERLRPKIESAIGSGNAPKIAMHAGEARDAALRYHDEATRAVERALRELENTSTALQDVLATLAQRGAGEVADVEREFRELESALAIPDPEQMRAELQRGLSRLRVQFENLQREKDGAIVTLRDELRTLQKRVEKAVFRPDAPGFATVLPREEFEAFVELEMESGSSFCLIYAAIANLSRIERFHGAEASQAAIAAFIARLQEHLRDSLAVGRLSPNQFCCVVNCSYDEAMRQVHQMTTALSEQTDSRGPLMPRFMTVRFTAEDGIERLRRKFADLQKQNP
jgi:GGDEF domain-containing protein